MASRAASKLHASGFETSAQIGERCADGGKQFCASRRQIGRAAPIGDTEQTRQNRRRQRLHSLDHVQNGSPQ